MFFAFVLFWFGFFALAEEESAFVTKWTHYARRVFRPLSISPHPREGQGCHAQGCIWDYHEEEEWVSDLQAGVHTCSVGSTVCIPAASCQDGVQHDRTPQRTCTEKHQP